MVRLSLAMIVKNEQDMIRTCLQSVLGLVDEFVIIDTGSTDGTLAALKAFQQENTISDTDFKILTFAWNDDFSAARNFSLMHATGDWILVLDADETIAQQDHVPLRQRIDAADASIVGMLFTRRIYITDSNELSFALKQKDPYTESDSYIGWIPSRVLKLFRNKLGIEFRNPVHELVEPRVQELCESGKKVQAIDIPIHNTGLSRSAAFFADQSAYYLALGEKKIKADPENPVVYYEQALHYARLKQYENALPLLQRALELNDEYLDALGVAVLIAGKAGNLELAKYFFERATELKPSSIISYVNMGKIYRDAGKFGEALNCFDFVVSINPHNVYARYMLGSIYYHLKQWALAANVWEQTIELDALHYGAAYKLALTFVKLNRPSEAMAALERVIAIAKKRSVPKKTIVNTYSMLSKLSLAREDFVQAKTYLQEVLARDDRADAHQNLGMMYEKEHHTQEALQHLKKAVSLDPQLSSVLAPRITKLEKLLKAS